MIGKTISHYEIIEKLGEGGHGCNAVLPRIEEVGVSRTVIMVALGLVAFLATAHGNTELEEKLNLAGQPNVPSTPPTLDCSGATPIECGQTYTYGGGTGPGNVTSYGCGLWDYNFTEEIVYEITTTAMTTFTVTMNYSHTVIDGIEVNDLDLFLLGSCDENDCLDFSVDVTGLETVDGVDLPAGTYYVVVDDFSGQGDGTGHTLTIDSPNCAVAAERVNWGVVKSKFVPK